MLAAAGTLPRDVSQQRPDDPSSPKETIHPMDTGKKVAIGGTLVLLAAVGIRFGMLVHQRHAAESAPAVSHADDWKGTVSPDALVFLKKKRPMSMKDLRELDGTTVWVSAGGQMDYYPVKGHHAEYNSKAGTLLGAQQMNIQDAIEQAGAPKSATFRVPGGDRQALLVFTLPNSADPKKEYAVPVGYQQGGDWTFYTDELFFYDDPHQLYKYWGPEVWKAIDEHRAILGMSEAEVQLALGQVSKSVSEDVGNRLVIFANLGHPKAVTFVKDKATAIRDDQGF